MIYYTTYILFISFVILWQYVVWILEKMQYRSGSLLCYDIYNPLDKTFPIGCCVIACDLNNKINVPTIFNSKKIIYAKSFSEKYTIPVGYILELEQNIIVMSSTRNTNDISVSLDTTFIDTPHNQFHRGYYNRAKSTFENIKINNNKDILLIGHSLGGAIVSILAYFFSLSFKNKIKVITFGSPKYSTSELEIFIKRKGINIIHYVNERDPIVQKPVIKRLTRVGTEYHFDSDTGNDISNHSLKVYLSAITKEGIKSRKHRIGQLICRILLDMLI